MSERLRPRRRSTRSVYSRTFTLAAGAQTITLDGFPMRNCSELEVTKVGGDGGDLWLRMDGQPTIPGGPDTELVLAGSLSAFIPANDPDSIAHQDASGVDLPLSVHYASGGQVYFKVLP